MLRHRGNGGGANLKNYERCTMDQIENRLERIHLVSDILLSIIDDNPKAQVLTQIIMELSLLPIT